jgi:hypothetical protein
LVFQGLLALAGCNLAGEDSSPLASPSDHPALAPPDGESRRGGPMVAADVADPQVLDELSRRYRTERDFERKQEYFLRLLDHYLFSRDRLTGMNRAEIERIFGPGTESEEKAGRLAWQGGRDSLLVDFKDGTAAGAAYIMGF